MDRYVLRRCAASTVAVISGAARPGSDYDGASQRARRHYERLGVDVTVVPDPRSGVTEALAVMADGIGMIVLPGGSPSGLLDVLGGEIGHRLHALQHGGTAISGASAGAMVLCQRMVRPDRGGDVVEALGFVEGLALPHWSPDTTDRDVPGLTLWGLPECGGVVIDGTSCVAVGRGRPSVKAGDEWRPIERPE